MIQLIKRLLFSLVVAQVFSFLSYLLIAQKFTPNDFGKFSALLATSSFLLPFATLRVEQKIYSHTKIENVISDVKTAYTLTTFVSLAFISVSVLGYFVTGISDMWMTNSFSYLGIILFALGINSVGYSLATYKGLKQVLGIWPIVQNATYFLVLLIFACVRPNFTTILIALFFSRIMPLFYMKSLFPPSSRNISGFNEQIARIKVLFKENKYPIITALSDQLIVALPVIGLFNIYSSRLSGLFALGVIFLQSPSGLLASAINSSILVNMSERTLKERKFLGSNLIKNYWMKVVGLLASVTLGFSSIGILMGVLDLGKWNGVGFIILCQSPPIILMILWIPLSSMLQSLGEWKVRFIISLIQVLIIAIPYTYIKFNMVSDIQFIVLASISTFIAILISCSIAISIIKKSGGQQFRVDDVIS